MPISLQEKELEILRMAVDEAEKNQGNEIVNTPEVKQIIEIVEEFLKKKRLMCYGGTAINNILPEEDQFYDKSIEIPDYDFYSPDALGDAKKLADLYYKKGYQEVEAKAGQHEGTFKVFVNFIPVADITQMDQTLYNRVKKHGIAVDGIVYTPPNFLRMSMFLELSRPAGNVGRWEKVLKRLLLLNKNYPLKGVKCDKQEFQRSFEKKTKNEDDIYLTVRDSFIDQGVVFFGGFANTLYSKYMPSKMKKKMEKIPDFDIISLDPDKTATILKERLNDNGIENVKVKKHKEVDEIIPEHYEVIVGKETICFIYKTTACYSYNTIDINNRKAKVASIDTMMSFYLAFVYANKPYYDEERILCMSQYLFDVQKKNRLEQKGLLKRFSTQCYGKQATKESMRAEKADKYKKLKEKRGTKEYDKVFLRYVPKEIEEKKVKKVKNVKKVKSIMKKTKKRGRRAHKKTKRRVKFLGIL